MTEMRMSVVEFGISFKSVRTPTTRDLVEHVNKVEPFCQTLLFAHSFFPLSHHSQSDMLKFVTVYPFPPWFTATTQLPPLPFTFHDARATNTQQNNHGWPRSVPPLSLSHYALTSHPRQSNCHVNDHKDHDDNDAPF